MKKILLSILMGMSLLALPVQAALKILHHFGVTPGDGNGPQDALVRYNGKLYGLTDMGGDYDRGTIFAMNYSGGAYSILHSFAGGNDDGSYPHGSLCNVNGVLYGMTTNGGGTTNDGTIFKLNADGSGYAVLYKFLGGEGDGYCPNGSLIADNGTLYGMTELGGASNSGTIFKISTSGSGYGLLHSFSGGIYNGTWPRGSLIMDGTTLYGMTMNGGSSNKGTIFKINPDGSGFALLHHFSGGSSDGANPQGSLLATSGKLFGLSEYGGSNERGTLFVINEDGSSFSLLHTFVGGTGDGSLPQGSLAISGSTLFGMAEMWGANNRGIIFKVSTIGDDYTLLHSFNGATTDGSFPLGSFKQYYGVLYGMTYGGGSADQGTVFTFTFPDADFDHDEVSDLMWRKYAASGSNCLWLMNQATGAAVAGEEYVENEIDDINVGAGYQPAQDEIDETYSNAGTPPDQEVDTLPEGEGLSTEYPEPEYGGPFGAINMREKVMLPDIADLNWKMCGAGYFNSGSEQDILWRHNSTGGAVAVWLMIDTMRYSVVSLPAEPDLKWQIVGVGDFNQDGYSDILWRYNGTGGKNRVWLMNGTSLLAVVNLNAQTSLNWKIVGCGDFNGDGKSDILWRFQGTGGKNQVWIMNGTARQSIVNIRAETNLNWKIAGVGDFDKNGKADIIWRNYSAGGANRIWIMNNTAYVRTESVLAVSDLTWKIEN